MTLDGGRGILASALKTLLAKWDGIEPQWHDTMRGQFVEEVLIPLQAHTTAELEAVDQMQVILMQMRRDCEGTHFDIHGGD